MKIDDKTSHNSPSLRFPEFTGEWEECKVSDLLDFYPTNSLSWDKLEYGTNAIQNLHYGLIHVGLPTMVDLSKDKLPNVVNGNTPKNYELCQEGDVAFADASEDTNEVAKAVEFYNLNGNKAICGLHTIHGRDNHQRTIVGYKGYAFSSISFHHQIRRIAQGTKIYSINCKNFSECYVGIPSKEEQSKIATLLRLIDERIAVQNRLIEDLKKFKCALEERMLGQCQGKQVRLRDILIERVEKSRINNQYEVLSSTVSGIYSQREYFNKEIASADNTGYKAIHRGDVVLSPQNLWMGNINYNDRFEIGIVSPSYKVFSIDEKFDKGYIAFLLKTRKALWAYSLVSEQGASIVRRNLNYESFLEISFVIPSLKEQQATARRLSAFKQKQTMEEAFLRSLLLQKEFMLKSLFI